VLKVVLAELDQQDFKDHKEYKVVPDLMVFKDHKVQPVLQVFKVAQDLQV
jgi:hypothetical protein